MAHETPVQPKLADLLAGYLQQKASAQAAGLASFDPEAEVVPYEAGPVQPIDAKLAWEETMGVGAFFVTRFDAKQWQAPPQWPNLVAAHEPVVALACALGNFPQLVRHLHTILQAPNLNELRPVPGRPVAAPALLEWTGRMVKERKFPQMLLALGALRLAKQFEEAEKIFLAQESDVPEEWRTAWENEKAALAWHQGDMQKASAIWQRIEPVVPVLFNRGMADLFMGRLESARDNLTKAVAGLAEEGAWHHLGRLYLTLAQRGSR